MSTAIADLHETPADLGVNYLNASYGIRSWLLTKDHKRIGLLYLATITLMFFVGGTAAVLMRLHLIEPQGALFEPETYNKMFSTHGIIMVFFFLVPSIPATLGQFFDSPDDRRPRRRIPETESHELVHLYNRVRLCTVRDSVGRRRYRLDVLPAL